MASASSSCSTAAPHLATGCGDQGCVLAFRTAALAAQYTSQEQRALLQGEGAGGGAVAQVLAWGTGHLRGHSIIMSALPCCGRICSRSGQSCSPVGRWICRLDLGVARLGCGCPLACGHGCQRLGNGRRQHARLRRDTHGLRLSSCRRRCLVQRRRRCGVGGCRRCRGIGGGPPQPSAAAAVASSFVQCSGGGRGKGRRACLSTASALTMRKPAGTAGGTQGVGGRVSRKAGVTSHSACGAVPAAVPQCTAPARASGAAAPLAPATTPPPLHSARRRPQRTLILERAPVSGTRSQQCIVLEG